MLFVGCDSVTGSMPVTLSTQKGKFIIAKRIDSINVNNWTTFLSFGQKKEFAVCGDFTKIWTSGGWKEIKRVIRHKTNKRIFRIKTEKGIIEVTEDHSLIRSNGELATPFELQIGDDLLHKNIN